MTTGQRIRVARKKAGMTQAELAKKLDIPFQSISQWERDIRNPKYETLQRIASALNVAVGTLFTDREREISEVSDIDGWLRAIDHYNVRQKEEYIEDAHRVLDIMQQNGYSLSSSEKKLIRAFSTLNEDGQKTAIERIEELTEIAKYQKSE